MCRLQRRQRWRLFNDARKGRLCNVVLTQSYAFWKPVSNLINALRSYITTLGSYCRQFVLTYHCEMFIGMPAEIDTANIFVIVIEAFGKYQNFLQEVNVGANLLRGKLIKHLSSNECHCLSINWFLGQESFAVRSCHSSVHSSCWIRIPNTTSTLFYL